MKKTITWICLVLLSVTSLMAQDKKATTLNVATFNLRMDTQSDGENAWPNRKDMVNSLIRFYELDIIGTQEGFKHQLDDILAVGDYAYVGGGRDDGRFAGEHSAILYNKKRLKVVDKGDFWFSETPDVPGKGWDATCCNRICSWAKFRDRHSGKVFFVFNAHYDHQGKIARKNSSLLLLAKIDSIAGKRTVFVTGDFNAAPDSEPIQTIYHSGLLKDSYLITKRPPYGTTGTFNSFKPDAPMKDRIDYIWVTPDVTVKKYGVINDMHDGRFPSDHFPVAIKAKL